MKSGRVVSWFVVGIGILTVGGIAVALLSCTTTDTTTSTQSTQRLANDSDSTVAGEETLHLSRTIFNSGEAAEVIATTVNSLATTTVTIDEWVSDTWQQRSIVIGPDILYSTKTQVPISIPSLPVGTYRLSLGDDASASFEVR